ncbi:hypothetical protein LEP1GSC161_1581 [Leptospira santarosai str. CBC1416]|uniref:Uncharacterized protein n=1 Tax=Leptospira santarosai str. CBC1416 TaxID=1193059 RepID=M6W885_9LEPT|nr:hypothetical protein LEP1GSC161_1581 [Leptospira santarosai str. CBC1416]
MVTHLCFAKTQHFVSTELSERLSTDQRSGRNNEFPNATIERPLGSEILSPGSVSLSFLQLDLSDLNFGTKQS